MKSMNQAVIVLRKGHSDLSSNPCLSSLFPLTLINRCVINLTVRKNRNYLRIIRTHHFGWPSQLRQ